MQDAGPTQPSLGLRCSPWVVGGPKLAAGSGLWPTAEMEGWREDGHRPLAGGGEAPAPEAPSNPVPCILNPVPCILYPAGRAGIYHSQA
jgi:hypothetical protein